MIFDTLSNAAYRVSLYGPGAEIEGQQAIAFPRRAGPLNLPPWWKI